MRFTSSLLSLLCFPLLLSNGVAQAADAPSSQATPPDLKPLASFDKGSPFTTGELIREFPSDRIWPIIKGHVTEERVVGMGKGIEAADGALILQGPMDWRGYDFLKVDVFNSDSVPRQFGIEAQDKNSKDFWNQILYTTILRPGANTVALPLDHIRNGGKGRPKEPVALDAIRLLALKVYSTPEHPAIISNLRLENDTATFKLVFDGLYAFDLGTERSPVMKGFKPLDPTMEYTKQRGYGLKNAQLYGPIADKRAFDGFQPDPLYRDFLAIEKGGVAVDMPNGKYRVFINIDSPSGYWGECQVYRTRKVTAEGKVVVDEKMDFAAFRKNYFRHYDSEDSAGEDVWEKYVKTMFHEKTFDVEVADGQLNLDFDSQAMGCSVSAIVVYPVEKAEQGKKFLDGIAALRKWHFENDFKQVQHVGTGANFEPTAADKERGAVLFNRDFMADVFPNDKPQLAPPSAPAPAGKEATLYDGVCRKLEATVLPGQSAVLEFSILPTQALDQVTLTASHVISPLLRPSGAVIPAEAFDIGCVSSRITRQNLDGTIFTVAPRYVMPSAKLKGLSAGATRRYWIRLRTPANADAGLYKGSFELDLAGKKAALPVEITVLHGKLDELDIPAGPFGHTIDIPWFHDDPEAKKSNDAMVARSFRKMLDAGFTACSGLPVITYKGFKDGKPVLDFTVGDAQMKAAREAGFKMPFITYCGFYGLDLYTQDTAAMKAAGFTDYAEFLRAIFTEVQRHSDAAGWLPRYWNLGDEPAGKEAIEAAVANMQAYRKAFPKGPPEFTFCGSCTEADPNDPHFQLALAAHVPAWNLHTEQSVNALRKAGGEWAFYNGGDRWTFGDYMYKCAKEFGMKFRPCWHWNIAAGDPYYALDCREDDYCWCNASPDGDLVPSLFFERLREGLTDYRALLTLARLANEKKTTPEGNAAARIVVGRMNAFKLGDRSHDKLLGAADWAAFRAKAFAAIDAASR